MQLAIENTMMETTEAITFSRRAIWAGRLVSGFVVLFLLMDGIMKLFKPEIVVTSTVELGYQESVIVPLGILLTATTILYILPRTAFFGAILLTGYLGGAVATHIRVGAEGFPIVFPVIIGSLLWLGLYLRDERLRALVPLRS